MPIPHGQPTVSIIIPVYNRSDCLRRSIQSVMKQTFRDWELLVVDDGSTEDIKKIVDEIQADVDQKVTYIKQENQGPGCARRKGLIAASGLYIQYLDSDDEILPEKIQKQIIAMQEDSNIIMCYCPTIQVNKVGTTFTRIYSDQHENKLLKGALEWRRWSTSSCLWRYPEVKEEFWSNFYNGEDLLHDVTVGVLYPNKEVSFIPDPLTIVHYDSNSVSRLPNNEIVARRYRSSIINVKKKCYDLLKENGLLNSKQYSIPLAERFFHSGLQLLRLQDITGGEEALRYCTLLSKHSLRAVFSYIAIAITAITKNKYPQIFTYMFKVYKKLVSRKVHFGRSV